MGDELKTERLGLFVEAFFVTPSLFLILFQEDALVIGLAGCE